MGARLSGRKEVVRKMRQGKDWGLVLEIGWDAWLGW